MSVLQNAISPKSTSTGIVNGAIDARTDLGDLPTWNQPVLHVNIHEYSARFDTPIDLSLNYSMILRLPGR